MAANYGGIVYDAYLRLTGGSCRTTIQGDSLTSTINDTDRFAHRFMLQMPLGGNITALTVGYGTFGSYNVYTANETSNQANTTNGALNAQYGYWGDSKGATPTTDEYYGIPAQGHNWNYDGNLQTVAGGRVYRVDIASADPWSAGVNTCTLLGTTPRVSRWLYYGAANLNAEDIKRGDGGTAGGQVKDTIKLTVDARPLWSEGDDPDNDASPRTGGPVTAEANAVWPDFVYTHDNGEYRYINSAVADEIPDTNGSVNMLGDMWYQCGASDTTWTGGHQVEIIGASSWDWTGFSEDTASAVATPKSYDNANWLTFRDVSTISRSTPGVFIHWVAPENISAANMETYTKNYIDKVTSADASVGNPVPLVIIVISYKVSSSSTAQMDAYRDGIIAGCNARSNAGYINLYDFYSQATPANVSDGTHPDNDASASAIFANFQSIMQSATAGITVGGIKRPWNRYHGYVRKGQRF